MLKSEHMNTTIAFAAVTTRTLTAEHNVQLQSTMNNYVFT